MVNRPRCVALPAPAATTRTTSGATKVALMVLPLHFSRNGTCWSAAVGQAHRANSREGMQVNRRSDIMVLRLVCWVLTFLSCEIFSGERAESLQTSWEWELCAGLRSGPTRRFEATAVRLLPRPCFPQKQSHSFVAVLNRPLECCLALRTDDVWI